MIMSRLHWLLAVLMFISILLSIFNAYTYYSRFSALQNSVIAIQRTKSSVQTPIDYSKIETLISQQVASLPKPQNGLNGKNGANGLNGKNGKDGTPDTNATPDEIAAAVVTYLNQNPPAAGPQGPQGEAGIAAQQVELRCIKNTIQWRYSGQFTWTNLIELGETETCS